MEHFRQNIYTLELGMYKMNSEWSLWLKSCMLDSTNSHPKSNGVESSENRRNIDIRPNQKNIILVSVELSV